ncbi:DUF2381 family protein [Pyxidicoccus sp. 3LG]
MSSSPSLALLATFMLLLPRTAYAQPALPTCEQEAPTVELVASDAGRLPEVCIRPGRTTAWVFDSPLLPESLNLEDHDRFQVVESGRRSILVVPSEALRVGTRLKLTVRFADGALPVSVEFILVVHPTRATRQVDVSRRPRTADSLGTELKLLLEENARLRMELSQVPRSGGLTELLSARLVDERGVSTRSIHHRASRQPGAAVLTHEASSQRSARRVLVLMDLENLDASRPWTTRTARLTAASGRDLEVLMVSQSKPMPPGGTSRIIIEASANPTEALGIHTLMLMEADGVRSLTVEGITFPDLVMKP